MVIQSTTREWWPYYYRASPTLPQCSECPGNCLMFYTCNYNIRVTHRNGAIKHIFYTNQIHGGIISRCSLFILSLHALALHLAVEILLQIFAWRFEHVSLTTICRLYFPPECQPGPHFVTQPILLSENIPNIWHKSSTKHKEVRQIETIKTIMQTTRPRITWKVYQWLSCILKKYSIKCEKI